MELEYEFTDFFGNDINFIYSVDEERVEIALGYMGLDTSEPYDYIDELTDYFYDEAEQMFIEDYGYYDEVTLRCYWSDRFGDIHK